jgi:hypothetical protein
LGVQLPRSGVELGEMIAQRWRWFSFRVRFHPWTTNELPRIAGTLQDYIDLTRLNRPIGIWLLLWPTLWAVWIAGRGRPDPHLFVIFVAGTVLMRSAGCAINDYADRSFDPHVDRTKQRPLAAGRISTVEALILFAVLSLMALVLALQLNKMTLLLAVFGAFLAVRQALLVGAAALLGRDIRLGYTDGVRGATRTCAAGSVAAVDRQHAVGHRLRHNLRHGRSRR